MASTLREQLLALHERRLLLKAEHRGPRRKGLSKSERVEILQKTDARCHICGGEVDPKDWNADHILAHSAGGEHSTDNYLPAHGTCNNYRWDYLPEEFQIILKLGVWARTQVEKGTPVGREIETRFSAYDANRVRRQRGSREASSD